MYKVQYKLRQPLPYYPDTAGVYVLTDALGKVLYVGQSNKLCRRVSYLTAMQKIPPWGFLHTQSPMVRNHQQQKGQVFVEFIDSGNAVDLEKKLIEEHGPPWNKTASNNRGRTH